MTMLPDRIVLMYSGSPHAHVSGHQWDIGLANLRVDGFAAMEAAEQEGTLLTQPLSFPAGRLIVNAEVDPGGYVLVEAVDDEGKPLAGYAASECRGISKSALDHHVVWQTKRSLEASPPVGSRLRFVLKNARVYSFRVDPTSTEKVE